jgi:dienelactone hydrolase
MENFQSGTVAIDMEQHEPATSGRHPGLLLLHGSGGAGAYWMKSFAPTLTRFGVAAYAPHYLQKTGSQRATPEMILDGKHFPSWLGAIRDAVSYVAARPAIDARRIGVLGVSLGGYLAMALAMEDRRLRAVVELSGGLPPGWEDRVSPAMPPVLILHGANDSVVPVSEAYKLQKLLQQRQVPCEMEIFPGEGHWFSAGAQARLLMAIAGFLGRRL